MHREELSRHAEENTPGPRALRIERSVSESAWASTAVKPRAKMDGEEIWTEVGLQEEKILGIDYILCTCVYDFSICMCTNACIHT